VFFIAMAGDSIVPWNADVGEFPTGIPRSFRIGPVKHAYIYTGIVTTSHGPIYTCSRGSDYKREGEILALIVDDHFCHACDCVIEGVTVLTIRQPVFRCALENNPLTAGWHEWEQNWAASPDVDSLDSLPDWRRGGMFETTLLG
jgi:hypothetical protein